MKIEEAVEVVAIMCAGGNRQLTETELLAKAALVEDLEYAPAREAAVKLAQSQTWLPSVAELREMVLTGPRKSGAEAWGDFLSNKPDELAQHVAKMLFPRGWGMTDVRDEVSHRARFIECYDEMSIKDHKQALQSGEMKREIGTTKELEQGNES